ncbi:MAG: Lrp/AsnC family transcriptional regulator [Rhodocyclaceae bacterium]
MRLDRYDLKILQILQRDGRVTKTRLAEEINLSVSSCWERVKRLESLGVIRGYTVRIDFDKLMRRSAVLVEVSLGRHDLPSFQRFEQAMAACPEVVECYATGGGVDYIVKVMARDIAAYQRIVDGWLEAGLGIERYFTYVVTKTVKEQAPSLDDYEPGAHPTEESRMKSKGEAVDHGSEESRRSPKKLPR